MRAAPISNVGLMVQALSEPSAEMARIWTLINRYRLNVWPWNIVVVAHGTAQAALEELARIMSVLSAIGWTQRFRPLPRTYLAMVCWWRWPEMRGAMYRECFRIDVTALDEVNLADALARARRSRSAGTAGQDFAASWTKPDAPAAPEPQDQPRRRPTNLPALLVD